jgi:hypothetical protein
VSGQRRTLVKQTQQAKQLFSRSNPEVWVTTRNNWLFQRVT